MVFRRSKKQSNSSERRGVRAEIRPTADVFSYHAQQTERARLRHVDRQPLGTPEEGGRVRVRSKLLVQLPTYLALAAIVLSSLYMLLLSSSPRVQLDEVSSDLTRPLDIYEKTAQKILNDSIWSKTKLTFDPESFSASMRQAFPELKSVRVQIPLVNQRPIVTLEADQPAYVLLTRQGVAYFINGDGRVLMDRSATIDQATDIATIRDESGLIVKPGDLAVNSAAVAFITTIITGVKNAGYSVESITLAAAPQELQLKLQGKPFIIRLNTAEQGAQQVGTLLALLKTLSERGVTPAEYVDLRVSEKAYYK